MDANDSLQECSLKDNLKQLFENRLLSIHL